VVVSTVGVTVVVGSVIGWVTLVVVGSVTVVVVVAFVPWTPAVDVPLTTGLAPAAAAAPPNPPNK